MKTTLALAGLSVLTFAAATVTSHTAASAQSRERDGITLPSDGRPSGIIWCEKRTPIRPGAAVPIEQCTQAEARAAAERAALKFVERNRQLEVRRQQKMQQEMDAEARAYQRMKQERQRNTPTTEHCFMKNGALVCKPV